MCTDKREIEKNKQPKLETAETEQVQQRAYQLPYQLIG